MALELMQEHALSKRRACDLASLSRSQFDYESKKTEDPVLVKAILKLKKKRSFYGVNRVTAHLRRKGFIVNRKRVRRLLKTLNLLVKRKTKPKKTFVPVSQNKPEALVPNDVWSIDFVTDRLHDGSSFRCFTIVDTLTREVPGIFAAKSMAGFKVVDYLEQLKQTMSFPRHIILDNGPEFANYEFVRWCERNGVNLHFIDPGKPVQNAYIESFNGKFRQEFLQQNRFRTIADVRRGLVEWLKYYNEERPHSSLDGLTPKEFADQEMGVLGTKINLPVLKTG